MDKKIKIALLGGLLIFSVEFILGLILGFSISFLALESYEQILDNISSIVMIMLDILVLIIILKRTRIKLIFIIHNFLFFKYFIFGILVSSIIYFINYFMLGPFINNIWPVSSFYAELGNLTYLNQYTWANYIIFLLLTGIVFPFIEEIYLRGILFNLFRFKTNFTYSFFLVFVAFLFFHPIPQAVFYYFLVNFLLCFLYEKNKSIILPFVVHSFINILTIIQFHPKLY